MTGLAVRSLACYKYTMHHAQRYQWEKRSTPLKGHILDDRQR